MIALRAAKLVFVLATCAGCITTETTSPAPATTSDPVLAAATELWEVRAGDRLVGWVVRYTPPRAADAFLSVRNEWQQELGMIDAESRWWRFVAHEREARLLGAGATADGVASILGLEEPVQLLSAPLQLLGR
jgi:hypothetical protein